MIRNMKKNKEIIYIYSFYIAYILIKSILFYKFKISLEDYINNFQGGNYYIIELLPTYLAVFFILLKDDNIYYNYRLKLRANIIIRQYKKIIVHTIVFVSLNFIICILLFNNVYKFFNLYSVLYFVLLAMIHMLGYMLVSGMILLLNQFRDFQNINSIMLVYMFIAIEYFVFYQNILSSKIPIIISWVFVDKSLVLRIVILIFMNNVLYRLVYNKSLNREFVTVKYDI